jgi:hypothetical protein
MSLSRSFERPAARLVHEIVTNASDEPRVTAFKGRSTFRFEGGQMRPYVVNHVAAIAVTPSRPSGRAGLNSPSRPPH